MFNLDKMKQAGSLMKQMNSLKKKIDKLETAHLNQKMVILR